MTVGLRGKMASLFWNGLRSCNCLIVAHDTKKCKHTWNTIRKINV